MSVWLEGQENALKELKALEVTFGYHERLRARRDIGQAGRGGALIAGHLAAGDGCGCVLPW